MTSQPIKPPFTEETARLKVQAAEDAWNTRHPERVAMAYSENSEWRNRTEFLRGQDEIRAFLRGKWSTELDHRLKKTLWCGTDDRIAVTFEYEWHDEKGNWFRSYGNELWEFDDAGRCRDASLASTTLKSRNRTVVFAEGSRLMYVKELWRYPVKSLAGEQIGEARIGPLGIARPADSCAQWVCQWC